MNIITMFIFFFSQVFLREEKKFMSDLIHIYSMAILSETLTLRPLVKSFMDIIFFYLVHFPYELEQKRRFFLKTCLYNYVPSTRFQGGIGYNFYNYYSFILERFQPTKVTISFVSFKKLKMKFKLNGRRTMQDDR